jgi:BAG domain/Ubiquitin family
MALQHTELSQPQGSHSKTSSFPSLDAFLPASALAKLPNLLGDSSRVSSSLTVASSHISTWASDTWDRAVALIRPTPQPTSLNDQILELITKYSTASYTTVSVLLLSLLFVAYRHLMSGRDSFGYYGGRDGGRASPFLSNLAEAAPRNLSGHFEYIGPDDEIYSQHRPSASVYNHDNDPEEPDLIHVQYMGRMLPIIFPAYSINEETTSVGHLRKNVARTLGTDASKIRLIYKRRELKQNRYSLKKYGMKQNSEVTAIMTERSIDYDRDGTVSSGSDSESSGNPVPQPRRPRAQSTVRLRSDEDIPRQSRPSGPHLHPNGHVPSASHRDLPRPSGAERVVRREREPSTSRGASPAPPTNNLPAADPNTPLGKLQALASTFHTQFLPPATKFLLSPPSDPDQRHKEHLKLSESIMAQIVLKADDIQTEGNVDARNTRKNLVNEANRVLRDLDGVKNQS